MSGEQGSIALQELKVDGDELSYRIPASGGVVVKLTVAGAAMNGTFTAADGAAGKVTASRAAAAAKAASVAGHWNCEVKSSSGRQYKLQLDLAEEGGKLSGTITRADGSAPIDDVKLDGNNALLQDRRRWDGLHRQADRGGPDAQGQLRQRRR